MSTPTLTLTCAVAELDTALDSAKIPIHRTRFPIWASILTIIAHRSAESRFAGSGRTGRTTKGQGPEP